MFDPQSNQWYVVIKNPETKLTDFHRLITGKSKFLFSTSFWSGISDCKFGKLVLHEYIAPDRPEPIGISVLDGDSGQLLWVRPELIFQCFLNESRVLAVSKNQESFQYMVLDMASGNTVNNYTNDVDLSLLGFNINLEGDGIGASIYREGEEDFSLISLFISKKLEKSIVGLVEYMETDRLIVISYYIRASNAFINECAIFDLAGEILAIEILASKADQLALNTFLVQDQTVVLIKERKEVVFYEL